MKRRKYLFQLFLLIVCISCDDVIEVNTSTENPNIYAVEAKITSDQNPYVYFYTTLTVDDTTGYPGISGATVVISDDQNPSDSISLTESSEETGLYIPASDVSYYGSPGVNYTLTIRYNGISITATDSLAKVAAIDSIQIKPSEFAQNEDFGIYIFSSEPGDETNYYKWDIYVDGELHKDAEDIPIAKDELVNGNYISGFEIFTDIHDDDEEPLLKTGSSVQVYQTSISKFVYLYYYQLFQQNLTGSLFSVPPANIESNLTASDGSTVLGLFSAEDRSASNTILITQKMSDELE